MYKLCLHFGFTVKSVLNPKVDSLPFATVAAAATAALQLYQVDLVLQRLSDR